MKFVWLLLLLIPAATFAQEAHPLGENPAVEARLKTLAVELRCLVCQNQTLADSNAPLAEDLRREVRAMIAKNMTDEQIIEFLVARYGDFVRYRPPVKPTTILLWVGPFLLLAIGATVLTISLRRRAQKTEEPALSPEERDQAARLLEGGEGVVK
jgi:cytochrome c-type biogenesis protein CcmH